MILVTGAGGMVGLYVARCQGLFSEPLDLTDMSTLDVCDAAAVAERCSRHRYSHVIHLAAATDLDQCERNRSHAFAVNAQGTANMTRACLKISSCLVYVSTACVFGGDGAPGPYAENDAPSPSNNYGASKLAGEKTITSTLTRYLIVRTGWMMGGEGRDKKFVGKIVRQLREKRPIRAVTDRVGTPTFAKDLVFTLAGLVGGAATGIHHITNSGVCSRFELALAITRRLAPNETVHPVTSEAFQLAAIRPTSEELRRTATAPRVWMRSWEDALDAYLREWNPDVAGSTS